MCFVERVMLTVFYCCCHQVGGEGGKGKGGPKGGRLPCTLALVSVVMNVGTVVSHGEVLLSLCA